MDAIESRATLAERDDQPEREPSRFTNAALQKWLMRMTFVGIVAVTLAFVAMYKPGAWILIGTLAFGVCFMPRQGVDRRQVLTILLAITVLLTTVDYLSWRIEVANWVFWGIVALPLLVAETFGALHTLGFQYTIWPRSQPMISCEIDPTLKPIFILIPTVNEGPAVLKPTILAAMEARRRYLKDFPHAQVTIAVCNDGKLAESETWRDVELLAVSLGARCVTRTQAGGAKAGNIELARQMLGATGDAFIVIFDADQIAHPDFLRKTMPWFMDPKVGWVQTGQYYSNLDQPVARWAHDQQQLFYQILCPGKAAQNAAFICGTNVVIRAQALDDIGGLPQDSITEDFAASIKLHPTWRSIFLTDVLATGLGPMDMPAYLKQQRRWATGTIGVLRTHWRDILLPRRGGLSLQQRVQYLLACTHYFSGLRDLVFVVAPLLFLVTGIPAVRTATLGEFLWHFVPYFIAAQGALWFAGHGKTGLTGMVIGFASFPALIHAIALVIVGRPSGFMVTSKQRSASRSWNHLTIYIVLTALCLIGVIIGLRNTSLRIESTYISIMWVCYDLALLGSVLWLGFSDLRLTTSLAHHRGRVRAQIAQWRQSARALNPGWAVSAMTGVVVITSLLLVTSSHSTSRLTTFTVSERNGIAPALGLSLPVEILNARPATLEQQVCLPFTIIGRTQTVQDSFDFNWANRLAATGDRPWITLQFGVFGPNDTAPLDASLPAIVNGVQDNNLRRWAQDVHTYGRPVLLTVLLHVDRNWSVSSAVANGGIPEDVPRAWGHVQSIFAAAGDKNIAWVWAPADPANDQAFAPPSQSIDVVLQSMIRYPDTPWPDPNAVLNAVAQRHPGKPVILEVSAEGAPAEKAVWLKKVGATVIGDPQVYALLYHEGAPDVRATPSDNTRWSVESDKQSLDAMRSWQALEPASALPCGSSTITKKANKQAPQRGQSPPPAGALFESTGFKRGGAKGV